MGAIYVMWIRQLKRYFRSKPRMISQVAQPLLFLLALGFGFGPIFEKAGGGSYIQYLAPGIIAMSVMFTSVFTGIEVIWDRQFGFLKETLVAPVSRFKIMTGRTLGGATIALLQGVLIFLITLAVGFRPASWAMVPMALVFMFLIAIMFTAFGTAIASKLSDMQAFPIIMNFLVMPLFFLSGSLFPLTGLSPTLEIIVKLNPLAYGVDGLHSALTLTSNFGVAKDLSVLLGISIVLFAIGSYLFSKIEI